MLARYRIARDTKTLSLGFSQSPKDKGQTLEEKANKVAHEQQSASQKIQRKQNQRNENKMNVFAYARIEMKYSNKQQQRQRRQRRQHWVKAIERFKVTCTHTHSVHIFRVVLQSPYVRCTRVFFPSLASVFAVSSGVLCVWAIVEDWVQRTHFHFHIEA